MYFAEEEEDEVVVGGFLSVARGASAGAMLAASIGVWGVGSARILVVQKRPVGGDLWLRIVGCRFDLKAGCM